MSLKNEKLPKFAFGMMRLPENENGMDIEQINEMVDLAMENGFNYFDTAYVYDNGISEESIKKTIVDRYPRESYYLADKLPSWKLEKLEDRDRILNESLERLGVDYIDLYLLHSLEDGNHVEVYSQFDCYNWAQEKIKEGKIKHFGFSYHGSPELLEKTLDEHPEIEFVQIQLNYEDMDNPIVQSEKLYNILRDRNIPIIVMEPVKGGKLANPEPKIRKLLKEVDAEATPASIALRYVGSLDGITTILSGMSNLDQMKENVAIFKDFKPLSDEEMENIQKVQEAIMDMPTVSCTACSYCTEDCPVSMDIPNMMKAVNAQRLYPGNTRNKFFYNSTVDSGSAKASECIECGQCEGVCPQHLTIIEYLKEAAQAYDNQTN